MKRIISMLLAIALVLCSSVLTALPVSAETRTGITFTADDLYRSESALAAMPATFESWIKVDADAADSRLGVIAGNYGLSGFAIVNYEIRADGNPSIYWKAPSATAATKTFTDVDVRTGEWLHLAIVNEGTELKCYVNGELKQTLSYTLPDLNEYPLNPIAIGADLRSGNAQYLKETAVSSVTLYQDARTQAEIAAAMTTMDYTDTNMLCSYDLSVSGNERLKDYSLQGNHLYYNNSSDSSLNEVYEAANALPEEGMAFGTDATYQVNGKFDSPIYTYEASIWIPKSTTDRAGVILGTYGSANPVVSFEVYSSGAPRLYVVNAEGTSKSYVFKDVSVALSKWVHMTIVRDEANAKLHCYVDGVLKQTLDIADTGYDVPAAAFGFGGDLRAGNTSYFQGAIRSVAVYNDVRTADEVLADVTAPGTDGLVASYNTANLADDVKEIADQSGNGYTVKRNQTWLDEEPALNDYAYSFALVGDTQIMNEKYPDSFPLIYDWLLDNAESRKMEFVFGLGDITNSDTTEEWERAMANITRMDGVVPYSLIRGNHDGVANFNKYIPYETFGSTVEGTYDGTMLNTWRTLKVGEIDYLLMTLDLGPSDEVLNWASQVIDQHLDHRVIITTHIYLYRDGTTLDAGDTAPATKYGGTNTGDLMWEKLMKKHANIQLVVSGHDPSDYVVLTQSEGENGNVVNQLLVDPQGTDNAVEGGTGMITMLYFSEDGNDVQLRTYSTAQQKWYMDANQYDIDMGDIDVEIGEQVEAQIAALNVKSLGDKVAVTKVRTTYESLNTVQKGYVTNVDALVAAEAAVVKLEAEAEANVEDKAAADVVVAQIAALDVKTLEDKAAVEAARAAYDALTDIQKSYVSNDYALLAAEEKIAALEELQAQVVDIQFRDLDSNTGVNGANKRSLATIYTEGTGAVKWAYTSDTTKETPFYYIYCTDYANVAGVDITGATHMTFDLYVEDISKLVFTSGDAGINLSDASGGWNNAAGKVAKATWLNTLKGLKNGWNHIVLPIDTSAATTQYVNRIRLYNVGGTTTAGFYTILDDVRFVNQAYFDSDNYDNSIAAKEVTAPISALSVQTLDDKAAVVAARTAYDALTNTQKALVPNLAVLEAAEAQVAFLEEAKAVEDVIAALNVQSLDDKPAVEAARAAYDALTDDQKAMVNNVDELETAESTIAQLEKAAKEAADQAAAKAVEDAIAGLTEKSALFNDCDNFHNAGGTEIIANPNSGAVNMEIADGVAKFWYKNDGAKADFPMTVRSDTGFVPNDYQYLVFKLYLSEGMEVVVPAEGTWAGGINFSTAFGGIDAAEKVGTADISCLYNLVPGQWNTVVVPMIASDKTVKQICIRAYNIFAGDSTDYILLDDVRVIDENEITLDSKAAVEAARAAYDGLTDAQKALVENLAVLEAAEATIDELQAAADKAAADKAAADEVIAIIDALVVESLEDKAAVEAARDAYDGLTEDQKALVTNLAALEEAEAAIVELEEAAAKEAADQAAANEVIAKIAVFKTAANKKGIAAARAAYEALTDDQKAKVTNLDRLEELENDAQKVAEVTAMIDAIQPGDQAAISAARAAYNALTFNQKMLITNEHRFVQLELAL